ncbi:MAG: substrate-binding domain-containing protein [Caldimonas sp.]
MRTGFRFVVARMAAALGLALAAVPLHALELRVLSAGAVEPGLRPALAAFTHDSGHTVSITFATAPVLRTALRRSPAAADVIVAPVAVVDEADAAQPPAAGATRAAIGRVGVGVAARTGADVPDITSAQTLKAALGSAEAVVFNRASTGVYVESMLRSMGLFEGVEAKSVRFADGASVMERLLAGTAPREFGFGAITEIVLFQGRGLKLVGPLPPGLQNYTAYAAIPWPGAPPASAAQAEAVAALMRHLQGPQARALFANAGIEPTP